ncbi:putative signal transducing protein [Bythopirellula polymerisocia]|uniref:DUF2007 domain-containing protein n=1 Tax=Bythopirellula polymerisocia TaxID=2528003 RepID=A0A5C6CZD6_9BACT|nr:DUF2007 domain-containing protein [Bythopirellula polymerisocia]TWU29960.1 hypothetical protein Pla144_07410 [Bythopirellula polymerisocia]
MSESVSIKSCATQEEAEFLKSLLETYGINALINADDYAGLPLMTSGGVQLQVLEEDVEKATKILKDAEDTD